MRVALILTDIDIPPREGLHEQSLLLARELAHRYELWVFAFTRDSSLQADTLEGAIGSGARCRVQVYRGPSVLFAIFAPWLGRRLTRDVLACSPKVVVLDGVAAIGLVGPLDRVSAIANWVDPGSRRWSRLASLEMNPFRRGVKVLASLVYRILERQCAAYSSIPWVFVSESDVEYAKSYHPELRIECVPVMLPGLLSAVVDSESIKVNSSHISGICVVIYVDARTSYGRDALRVCLAELSTLADGVKLSVRVMGRVSADADLVAASGVLNVEFLEWVPDPVAELLNADLVLIPDMVGTGIKNRSLQAIVLSKRVLATPVALEGIALDDSCRDAIQYVPGALAGTFARALGDGDDGSRAMARKVVLDRYSVGSVMEKWVELVEDCARMRP